MSTDDLDLGFVRLCIQNLLLKHPLFLIFAVGFNTNIIVNLAKDLCLFWDAVLALIRGTAMRNQAYSGQLFDSMVDIGSYGRSSDVLVRCCCLVSASAMRQGCQHQQPLVAPCFAP